VVVIVDYGMGNLASIANMLKKVAAPSIVSSDLAEIARAEKLVLPGVGAFDHGMRNLDARGLIPILAARALKDKIPVLGLCLGMQLFTQSSEEGNLPGLGWIVAETVRFILDADKAYLKIPHMGWNTLQPHRAHPIFAGLDAEARFYFVHSYHVLCENPENVLAQTIYGYPFASAVVQDNIIGLQFHPEKSHKFGMRVLKNFAELV
jgi:glutamine amidotransferase